MNQEVVTFGETMFIFDAATSGPLRYVDDFKKRIGGAESNVALGLTRLGHKSAWMSQLGNDEFGKFIVQLLRGEGVDVSRVLYRDDAPTGLFIKEKIKSDEHHVYYYRAHSAASKMDADWIDLDYIKNAKILHVTGITPLLSESCKDMTLKAMRFAKENGVFVSFDPNLRYKLMNDKESPRETILEMIKLSDLFIPGIDELEFILNEKSTPEDYLMTLQKMGVNQAVIKNGADGTYFLDGSNSGFVECVKVDHIVDPIGAGDGFAAGLLSGLLDEISLEQAVLRGNIVGARVITIQGDIEGLPERQQVIDFSKKKDVVR